MSTEVVLSMVPELDHDFYLLITKRNVLGKKGLTLKKQSVCVNLIFFFAEMS